MTTKRLFLASSSELLEDRKEFEIFINRKNKELNQHGVFLDLVLWEDFLDAMSKTRLQDEYNKAIRECDLFVMLFFTKVGRYTVEEFETAFKQFQATNRPFIFTYFKDAEVSTGSADKKDLMSLWAFQEKLDGLGHFYTKYRNIDQLKLHFSQQLEKLAANGFIEFKPDKEISAPAGDSYQASLTDSGAIAQGNGATAVGAGGVNVEGNNIGNINTGNITTTKTINTGGGAYVRGNIQTGGDFVGRDKSTYGVPSSDLGILFEPLLNMINRQVPAERQDAAIQQAEALKAEVVKGEDANDTKIAKIVDGLVEMVPGAIGSVVSLFATPILGGIAGPVTKFVLDKLKGD